MQFKEFALHTDILKALEKLHYEQVLPIQEYAMKRKGNLTKV